MFSKFNIDLQNDGGYFVTNYYLKGLELYKKISKQIENSLDEYIDESGCIDGSKLQENWFSQIDLDIFISHSHKDEKLAISIAGWLHHEFGLISFVDSCLWGYSDNLLKTINDKYNIKKIEDDGTTTYYHNKANYASSHVHMMLCTSLNKMLDNCESIFFINTENSVISSEYSKATNSPWIYLETCLANTIQTHFPMRYPIHHSYDSRQIIFESAQLQVKYNIDLSKFVTLSKTDLLSWKKHVETQRQHPLDVLYIIHGILTKEK